MYIILCALAFSIVSEVGATFAEEVAYVTAYCALPSVACPPDPPSDYCMPVFDQHFTCDTLTQNMLTHFFRGDGDAFPAQLSTLSNLKELIIAGQAGGTAAFPSANLGALKNLRSLRVGFTNSITVSGTLPTTIGLLTKLESFQITDADMPDATIPSEIGLLTNLIFFSVSDTNIDTTLPSEMSLLKGLESFILDTAPLVHGPLPQFGVMPAIKVYTVRSAGVTELDDDALFFSPLLTLLDLQATPLTGTFPRTFGSATKLISATIQDVDIGGTLPENLGNAKSLAFLTLGGLPNMGGTVPLSIGELTDLQRLIFDRSGIGGQLPDVFAGLTNLAQFFLRSADLAPTCNPPAASDFSGNLPPSLIDLALNGQNDAFRLFVGYSCISGLIPGATLPPGYEFGDRSIILRDNQLIDPLPSWLLRFMAEDPGVGLNCAIGGNPFCFKPKPLSAEEADNLCEFELLGDIDECGVCNGDDSTCKDCAGVPNGSQVYDACDVCGGSNACVDCAGVPNGPATYDLCDVCNGSNACRDCAGTLGGTLRYDACGVCGGDNSVCADCTGKVGGTFVYDACGVCGGNGACIDCEGTVGGAKRYDPCGKCVDPADDTYVPLCYDCTGTANGTALRDLCGNCPKSHDCDVRARVLPLLLLRCYNIVWWIAAALALLALILCAAGGMCSCFCGGGGGGAAAVLPPKKRCGCRKDPCRHDC